MHLVLQVPSILTPLILLTIQPIQLSFLLKLFLSSMASLALEEVSASVAALSISFSRLIMSFSSCLFFFVCSATLFSPFLLLASRWLPRYSSFDVLLIYSSGSSVIYLTPPFLPHSHILVSAMCMSFLFCSPQEWQNSQRSLFQQSPVHERTQESS